MKPFQHLALALAASQLVQPVGGSSPVAEWLSLKVPCCLLVCRDEGLLVRPLALDSV